MDFWSHIRGVPLCLIVLLTAASLCFAGPSQRRRFTKAELQPVLEALEDDGFPRPYLDKVFRDSRLRKLPVVIGLNAMNAESKRDYSGFLTPYALGKARRFSRRYRKLLDRTERAYGVPRSILVALLMVETQFGKARLRYRVIEVFTSLVVDSDPENVERYYRRLKPKYPQLDRGYLEERMEQKGEWGYEELSALLTIGLEQGWDLHALKGSYAGAFGIPQFLPSSYLSWAVDGNGDDKINLDEFADAVPSVAAYLSEHGWVEDADLEEMRRAVWEYNHSTDYVDAIFAVARELGPPPERETRKLAGQAPPKAEPKPTTSEQPAGPQPAASAQPAEPSTTSLSPKTEPKPTTSEQPAGPQPAAAPPPAAPQPAAEPYPEKVEEDEPDDAPTL